ncbi:MAG: PHP domain-containing protein [Desulfarculales bacterium]|jgi:predicted metal-dependent phosphoesterase TrpH|nr:PHP domain-containing protein [Desulfarculales bacterium]
MNKGPLTGLVDLHTHSSVSDGSLTPAELVRAAQELGLAALALTDHDTVDGLDEALAAALALDLELVPGVEISVSAQNHEGRQISLHILGYFIDHRHPVLQSGLRRLIRNRNQRNLVMLERLNKIGCDLTLSAVESFKKQPGALGRPHFASALVAQGYARDIDDAFQRFLRRGAPGYVEKERLTPQEGISLIIRAGGLPALAHPGHLLDQPVFFQNLLSGLKTCGLGAMECYYPEYTAQQKQDLLSLSHRFDLAPCGGSDFHGQLKPSIHLGTGKGRLKVPYQVLPRMRQYWQAAHS